MVHHRLSRWLALANPFHRKKTNMAVILASCAFWAPVKFIVAGDDGKPEIFKFRARYKRLTRTERKELERRVAANSLTPDVRKSARERLDSSEHKYTAKDRQEIELRIQAEPIDDEEFLKEVLVDWELKDKKGDVVVFSLATLAELSDAWDGFEAALVGAFYEGKAKATSKEAVEKNSAEPSAITS